MKKIFLSAILFFTFIISFSQHNYLLQGNIDKRSVFFRITQEDDSTIYARYFSNDNLQDIFLDGKPSKKHLSFTKYAYSYTQQKDTFCESFTLTTTNNKNWFGNWTNGKTKLKVFLKPVSIDKIKLKPKREFDINEGLDEYYSNIRENKVQLHKDSITKINQLLLQWFTEKTSDVKLFRIVAGIGDTTILNKINNTLHEFQMNEVFAFYDCPNNSRKRGNYNVWIDSVYVTDNSLGLKIHSYYDCGGVHPNSADLSFNINLHTGCKIEKLTDIFNFDDSSIFSQINSLIEIDTTDKYENYGYSDGDTTAICIAYLMKTLHRTEMQNDDSLNENCRFSDYDRWRYFNFLFRYDGVYISPEFPHVMQSCSYPEWSVIPYSVLKKYLRKESKFVL